MDETITVTQLNTRVKSLMTDAPGITNVWVTGEISNFKVYSSGHCYFTLKDRGSEIRCVMFRSAKARIDFEPKDSMEIAMYGNVDLYVERGAYQFIVQTMRRGGMGNLYAEFERLKNKLAAEGLFEQSRKRRIPAYPKVVGVVTSSTGAVIHDIVTTAKRRFPADILLAPAQVQGEGASASISNGIAVLNDMGVDVIIVGRGGGSIEDLWAFNEEITVRAIASSRVPIISAVGHESDFTLADFTADARAATPTAAAEMAFGDMGDIINQLNNYSIRSNRALGFTIERMRSRFNSVDAKLSPVRAEEMVAMREMRLDNLSTRLVSALKGTIEIMRKRYITAEMKLERAPEGMLSPLKTKIDGFSGRLDALNPYRVLGRGYSMITDGKGNTIISTKELREGMDIAIRMRDGRADARIEKVDMDD